MIFKILAGILFVLYPAVVYYGLTNGVAWIGLLCLIFYFVYKLLFVKKGRGQSIALICVLSLGVWLQQAAMIKLIPAAIHLTQAGLRSDQV